MSNDFEAQVAALQQKIALAAAERDAWKDRGREHFKMAALLVQSLEKQLTELLQSNQPNT